MQGRKNLQFKMYYQVSLDSLVSVDNFYRKLEKAHDLHFFYARTAPYYGIEGQESIETRRPLHRVFQNIVSGIFE